MSPERINAGELVIGIAADVRELQESSVAMQKQLAQMNERAKRQTGLFARIWKGALERVGHRITDFGLKTLKAGITLPINAAIGSVKAFGRQSQLAVLDAAKFQTSLSEVATLGVRDMGRLRSGVLQVSSSIGENLQTATRGAYQALSAGIPEENVIDFLRTSAQAAVAGVTDTATSVDALSTVINAYGLRADEASRISDQFFQIIKLGKTTFPELAQAIGTVLPTAAAVGVDFAEVGGALALMTQKGINTNEAVTALNALLLQLLSPAGEAKEAIGAIVEASGGLEDIDLAKAVGEFNKLTTEVKVGILGNVRSVKAALALGGDGEGDSLISTIQQVGDSVGATSKAFEEFRGTFEREWGILKQSLANARADIAQPIEEAFGGTLRDINELILQPFLPEITEKVKGFLIAAWEGPQFTPDVVQGIADHWGIPVGQVFAEIGEGRIGFVEKGIKGAVDGMILRIRERFEKDFELLRTGEKSFGAIFSGWLKSGGEEIMPAIKEIWRRYLSPAVDFLIEKAAWAGLAIGKAMIKNIAEGAKGQWEKATDKIWKLLTPFGRVEGLEFPGFENLEREGFQRGGIVPGPMTAAPDSVPAMLTPGELVVPRDIVGQMQGPSVSIQGGVTIPVYAQPGQSATDIANEVRRILLDVERLGLSRASLLTEAVG
jgi:TP901 family phage tail tape measure protein